VIAATKIAKPSISENEVKFISTVLKKSVPKLTNEKSSTTIDVESDSDNVDEEST